MRLSEEYRERTRRFASRIVSFYAETSCERREIEVLAHQLLRSGTSVAANVREASRARSDEEFCSKLGIAIQEADESALWIELLQERPNIDRETLNSLSMESNELIAVLVTIVSKTRLAAKRGNLNV